MGLNRTTAKQWAIAIGLRATLKDGPETFYRNFDPLRRERISHFVSPTTCTPIRALDGGTD